MGVFILKVNGKQERVEVEDNKPLLWVLREELGLLGTKYGCGKGFCGACTVHLNDTPARACGITIASVGDAEIVTIEGLDHESAAFRVWEEINVPQCGFCQTGQIMSASALLKNNDNPTDVEIDRFMNGNICRCGTYYRIRKALQQINK